MSFQRYGNAKRRGDKTAYYIVRNYHYNGGKQLERQTTNYKEAIRFASETPKAWIGAYTDDGALIGDYHQSPGAVPLNKRQLSARAREKAGHDHRNRSGLSFKHGSAMRTGVPSVKTILTYLGPGLHNEYGDNAVIKAQIIRRIMQTTPKNSRDVADSMNAINKELNAHGVEFTAQYPGELNPGEHFDYVNMGDTYTPTVIYHRGKFKIMSWGDLVESLERRGKRFQ